MNRLESFDGVSIAYDVAGEGPATLLLHGFLADAQLNWELPGIRQALVDAGRTVVSYDARGHGRSDKPHDSASYDDPAFTRDAQALLDHLGIEEVDVVGYSMGAIVTASLIEREPRIRSAVLGGIGGNVAGTGIAAEFRQPIVEALQAESLDDIQDRLPRQYRKLADQIGVDRDAMVAVLQSNVFRIPSEVDAKTPVLVLVGEDDTLCGSPHELARVFPGGEAAVVAGDHTTTLAEPAFVAALVSFLGRVASA